MASDAAKAMSTEQRFQRVGGAEDEYLNLRHEASFYALESSSVREVAVNGYPVEHRWENNRIYFPAPDRIKVLHVNGIRMEPEDD